MSRLVVSYAAITLVPVLVLGIVLAASFRSEARRRGLAEGRSEAALVAHTSVEPLLDGRPLSQGLSQREMDGLRQVVARSVSGGDVLRLRVVDLQGRVVFSDDGSGFSDRPEDEALKAAGGTIVARLTRLNTDRNDSGPRGVAAVELYVPLTAGAGQQRVGVLEMYLPYGPITRDVTAGVHILYRDLALGLAALYLVLFAIFASVSRGLRRQVALNAYLAEHDHLTDLPNRTLFHREIGRLLGADGGGEPVAVAIVDLDRFKEVNDTLGHHNGDLLLKGLAARLASHLRPGDMVARLGGDEFGVILRASADAERLLWELRSVVDDEVNVNGLPLAVEASVGFVLAPDDGTDPDQLLQRADVAMYVAKAQHAGVVRYDAGKDHYDAANLELVSELRHAIDAEQLVLHYQPKTVLEDGSVEAVEALVRWQHPVHGLLLPDRFLFLAEQTELIDKLTTWVLRRALEDTRAFSRLAPGLSIAVNVSARSLTQVDLAAQVADVLGQVEVSPSRLIIEITETSLLVDPRRAAVVLAELARSGVRISLDDFGSGQTSLGYLSALPIHELKIDKSFVTDMLANSAHAAIARSIIDLGHNLGLRVVAEGVETADVLASLKDVGCDVAQGYLLARPMTAEALNRWLAGRPERRARSAARPVVGSTPGADLGYRP